MRYDNFMVIQALRGLFCLIAVTIVAACARAGEETLPKVGDHTLRILTPNVLELTWINTKAPDRRM